MRGETKDGSQDLLVIKLSGVSYNDLNSKAMIVCDLDGNLVPREGVSSSDTAAHAYVCRHVSDVDGVVHMYSIYATVWVVRGEEILCVLTTMGGEFDGPVPASPFALIGDDLIGRDIVDTLRESHSPAVPMHDRGPFTIGHNMHTVVKTAIMVEEIAETVHVTRVDGSLVPIEQQHIDSLHDCYQDICEQH